MFVTKPLVTIVQEIHGYLVITSATNKAFHRLELQKRIYKNISSYVHTIVNSTMHYHVYTCILCMIMCTVTWFNCEVLVLDELHCTSSLCTCTLRLA